MLRKNITENSGMTRLQLLILVVIVIVIGALSFPPWLEYRKVGTADIDVETIAIAIKKYFRHTGDYPTSLDALVTDPGVEGWRGNYLESLPETPWGGGYVLLQDTYKIGIAKDHHASRRNIGSVVSRKSVESITLTRVWVRSIGGNWLSVISRRLKRDSVTIHHFLVYVKFAEIFTKHLLTDN